MVIGGKVVMKRSPWLQLVSIYMSHWQGAARPLGALRPLTSMQDDVQEVKPSHDYLLSGDFHITLLAPLKLHGDEKLLNIFWCMLYSWQKLIKLNPYPLCVLHIWPDTWIKCFQILLTQIAQSEPPIWQTVIKSIFCVLCVLGELSYVCYMNTHIK